MNFTAIMARVVMREPEMIQVESCDVDARCSSGTSAHIWKRVSEMKRSRNTARAPKG